jgi:hypothetical protein
LTDLRLNVRLRILAAVVARRQILAGFSCPNK